MKYSLLLIIALTAFGCSDADKTANDATQATVGSVDRAKEVAGEATSKVSEDQKTLDESEKK